MGIILAGILACALLFILMFFYDFKDYFVSLLGITLAIVCVVAGIIVGILVPVNGYLESQILSTTKLISLRNETVSEGSGLFYVSISGTNSYTYYVEVDSTYASNSQKAYKSNTISSNNVIIIEDSSYTSAKLVTYVRYGKKTFWTFAVGAKEYEYVFYVPPGTISRDISVG